MVTFGLALEYLSQGQRVVVPLKGSKNVDQAAELGLRIKSGTPPLVPPCATLKCENRTIRHSEHLLVT